MDQEELDIEQARLTALENLSDEELLSIVGCHNRPFGFTLLLSEIKSRGLWLTYRERRSEGQQSTSRRQFSRRAESILA